jgi:hypothetical protein
LCEPRSRRVLDRRRYHGSQIVLREFTLMKTYLLTLLCFTAASLVNAEDKNTNNNEDMNTYKKTVTLWYEAFTKKDPALLDQILHETWVDIP